MYNNYIYIIFDDQNQSAMKKIFLLIYSILLLVSCGQSGPGEIQPQRREVQACLDSLVIVNEIPGANFTVVLPDGRIENYSSGYEDIEENIPLRPDRVMFSGSVGKTYAVALLMQLVDQGKVSLHDRFYDYFPDIEWLNRLPNINEISVEMLLKHTSGLPRWVMGPDVWKEISENPDKIWSYSDRLSYVFDMNPVHPAGKGWGYSDTNYLLLGMLIEKLTGEDYYDLVRQNILEPLELKNTYPSLKRNITDLSQGYSRLPALFLSPEKVVSDGKYYFNPQMEWTGGGMASTTEDLARWAGLYYSNTLFSDSLSAKIMAEPAESIQMSPVAWYSLGAFIYKTKSGLAYGHTGFVPGFNAIFAYYPDSDLAVAMQFNSDFAGNRLPHILYLDQLVSFYTGNGGSQDQEHKPGM